MLEINLLPPNKRRPEGTPPARMAVILVSVLFSFVGLLLTVNYWMEQKRYQMEINSVADLNKQLDHDLKDIKTQEKKVKLYQDKLNIINRLMNNRLKWNRILFRLAQVLNLEEFRYVTLDGLKFRRSGKTIKIQVDGWATAGISSKEAEKEKDYNSLLYKQGWKLLAAFEYYTGAYHKKLTAEDIKKDPSWKKELTEINNFLGGSFSRWRPNVIEPSKFRVKVKLKDPEKNYVWVLPKKALKFEFSTVFTQITPSVKKSKKKK